MSRDNDPDETKGRALYRGRAQARANFDTRGKSLSLVRENLLTEPGYTPYCDADKCQHHWPRTTFTGRQFRCQCGWETSFEPDFMATYRDTMGERQK